MAYLKKYRRWMDYHGYRRVALSIGSGVTEAACKTIFDYRFSAIDSSSRACGGIVRRDSTCSTCGFMPKCRVWPHARNRWLGSITPSQIFNPATGSAASPQNPPVFVLQA